MASADARANDMPTATQTTLLPNQVDESLAEHFAALGVGTILAYKL